MTAGADPPNGNFLNKLTGLGGEKKPNPSEPRTSNFAQFKHLGNQARPGRPALVGMGPRSSMNNSKFGNSSGFPLQETGDFGRPNETGKGPLPMLQKRDYTYLKSSNPNASMLYQSRNDPEENIAVTDRS